MWKRVKALLWRRDLRLREQLANMHGLVHEGLANFGSRIDDLARRVDEIVRRDRVTASEVDHLKAECHQMRGAISKHNEQLAAQQADFEAFEELGKIVDSLGEDLELEAALAVCAFPPDRRLAAAPGIHTAHGFYPRQSHR